VTDQATRAHLEQIIAGLSEGVILVETDQTITYANPAALRMHDAASLDELGPTVDAYRRNYVLTEGTSHSGAGQHPIERVARGEAVDDVTVRVTRRKGATETWAHRIRSQVMTDAEGQPDYVVVIITDVTDQVEAEERFETTFAANPAPALICRLTDQRFVKVNEGFLELTGLKRNEVLGQRLHELDVLRRAERRDLALERLRARQTIPQMEASLAVPADSETLVIVAGQPIEVADEPCMLFTFADLEPRRRAEALLRHSEERFVRCFRLAPVPFSVASAKGHRFINVNDAFCSLTGHTAADVVGCTAAELGLWVDEAVRRSFERDLAREGHVRGLEARLRAKGGTEFDALVAADTVTIGGEPSILCAFQDISARKRSETELVAAIEAVMSDASWFAQAVVEKVAALRTPQHARPNAAAAGLADLTAREREVLGLICQGLGNDEIGQRLAVAANTVRNHVAGLYRKLGVNRRAALIVWARERGFGDGEALARRRGLKLVRKNPTK
jgi:PAS domain S-box-containing protein